MPIPWLVVLKSVPWTEVIRNAPKVADGAKRLWGTVAKKDRAAPSPAAKAAMPPAGLEGTDVSHARLQALEAATAELHEQMLASSELIKTLAEQNAQLIVRIDAQRSRLAWLGAAAWGCGIGVAVCLWLAWAGRAV